MKGLRRTFGRRGSVRLLVPLAGLACGVVGFGAESVAEKAAQVLPGAKVRGTTLAPGIVLRRFQRGISGVRVIDVDLSAPVRVEVAAEEIAVRGGRITGAAHTVPDWLKATGAVAGINGGFFGETVTDRHKEIVGLLKRAGRVRVAAPTYRSRPERHAYARSALGFTRAGTPDIGWVISLPGDPQALRRHPEPQFNGAGVRWRVQDALACGPRLIRDGKVEVADRAERLVSRGMLPRTFVGYGGPQNRYLALCTADAMEFTECAGFLAQYFRAHHNAPCAEAMCLDGGASTQTAWREGKEIRTEPVSGVTVPTALLVHRR
jgi:hypothetical protein